MGLDEGTPLVRRRKQRQGFELSKLRLGLLARIQLLMRSPLEWVLFVLCWPSILLDVLPSWLSSTDTDLTVYQLRVSLGLLLVTHLVVELPRWQMIIVYLATICSCLSLSGTSTTAVFAGAVLSAVGAFCTLLMCYLFPAALPDFIRGPYDVGATTHHIRAPELTSFGETDLEFMVKIYYPVHRRVRLEYRRIANFRLLLVIIVSLGLYWSLFDFVGLIGACFLTLLVVCTVFIYVRDVMRPSSAYLSHGLTTSAAVAEYAGMPWLLTSHLIFYLLPAYEEASCLPAPPEQLPVLLFLHGLGGSMSSYSTLVVEYASQGFVVVVPEFNDGSACITVFPDGRRTPHKYLQSNIKAGSDAEFQLRHMQVTRRAQETNLAYEVVKALANDTPLRGSLASSPGLDSLRRRIDLKNVFLIGHSFGGATCLEVLLAGEDAASRQSRFRGVVLLDAWYMPLDHATLHKYPLRVPLLAMHSELWQWQTNADKEHQLVANIAKGDVTQMKLLQTNHINFSDFTILAPEILRMMKSGGPDDPLECISIINNLVLLFIDQHMHRPPGSQEALAPGATGEWEFLVRDEKARRKLKPQVELLFNRAALMT